MDEHKLTEINMSLLKLLYKGRAYESTILCRKIIFELLENVECKFKVAESWHLVYSSVEHGFSLRTMVDNLSKSRPPFILICRENEGNTFGVFINDKICFKSTLSGKINTFLFKMENGQVKVFKYSGNLPYFCLCSPSFIGFGCSEGKFGLLFNSTLLTGSSSRVTTFNNEVLSRKEKFAVKQIEVWTIGH
ncbi:Oxidation resistance protein [Trachipleistophora hominis]|uniref:Oxidation resistance protein 1 n=1 Tax=Trachipleistophora hominis TaxID=72359 RepID=L7K0A7_TRAHO|nr:Oxidation resistance protein [Trachipleistophora hominis]